ncbi:t(6)A37 threonylcarbamoyladenosine biosynthesis protein [Weissella viridescens]|uniref:T(6)A37 threonylcarbamoyladenosine biosynthesis protein n=1 Tax=Weissella viridescens TaxID=1629 RepID=A0A380NZ84_WEIVI|nr:t(6)A37 threonylcarbamoyladenosine biosynthesis protein [Weissella viridescens]
MPLICRTYSIPSFGVDGFWGHTELVLMREEYDYLVIGDTRDDAAGEAYDKVGRTMGLKYPSGKLLMIWHIRERIRITCRELC